MQQGDIIALNISTPHTIMDFSPRNQVILEALALLFLYCLWKTLAKTSKNKKIQAPEPSGAWPLIGHLHLLGGKEPVCKTLGAIADKCGPIYSLRLGIRRVLVVSGWEIVKECFTTNDKVLATRANIAAGRHMGYNNAIFALAPYGEYWRDIRKFATLQLLSNHRLEKLKHVRLSEIDAFLKDLNDHCSNSVDTPSKVIISNLFERLTFNISLRMLVGKRFSTDAYSEETSQASRYKKAIAEATYLFGVFVMADAIPWLEWMDFQGHISAMKATAKELDAIIETWLEERMRKRSEGDSSNGESDFLDVLISNLPEGAVSSGHSREIIIKATILVLTLTSSGSTSITLAWALSVLVNHPAALKAAQEELDKHVGRHRWVEESDIHNLKFLQAVVKETLRLYPPGPITGIREAMEDCNIGGYHVPKGTRLIVDLWKLHRDPRVWEDPSEFKPERFLTTHADVDVRGQNFEFIPFGSGRRSCPAVTSGLHVVHLALARLLQGFDVRTSSGLPVDMTEGPGIAMPRVKPLEVAIKPRLGSGLYQCLAKLT